METLEKIKSICDGIEYSRDVPFEAKKLAKENGIIIIVGGSDDLMYVYGADSFLTDYVEHSEGWDGCDLQKHASDFQLRKEAEQLGLKIFWCGEIKKTHEKIEDYDVVESGGFSYKVKEGIDFLNFKVLEDEEVYCTAIIVKLPESFISYKNIEK